MLAENNKMDVRGIGCEDVMWTELNQHRVQWHGLVCHSDKVQVP
jgi:hypothetical protein